jgi:hypothetical protein
MARFAGIGGKQQHRHMHRLMHIVLGRIARATIIRHSRAEPARRVVQLRDMGFGGRQSVTAFLANIELQPDGASHLGAQQRGECLGQIDLGKIERDSI